MHPHRLLERLRAWELPDGHYAVFGSGPLFIRGVIDDIHDLDVLTREPAWSAVLPRGQLLRHAEFGVEIVDAGEGVTFGRDWGIGEFDTDQLIETADKIDGLPFVRLEHVIAYKQIADRPKDREHLRALETWQLRNSNG